MDRDRGDGGKEKETRGGAGGVTGSKQEFSGKNYYESLPLHQKRMLYNCEDHYVVLGDIETWSVTRKKTSSNSSLSNKAQPSPYRPAPFLDDKVSLWQGDIARLEIDAIVNATDVNFSGGGGVDRAIHRAAGPFLKRECLTMNCSTGQTRISSGYRLPAKYVLHTVGPDDECQALLINCYESVFEQVLKHKIKSVAFCCIATGEYEFPNDEAAELALTITRNWLEKHHNQIERIIFCVYNDENYDIYQQKLCKFFPPPPPVAWNRDGNDSESGGCGTDSITGLPTADVSEDKDAESSRKEDDNSETFVEEIKEAMSKNKKISRKLAHGILIGPTGAGKSSLMDRLLGRKRRKGFSSSTGVSESVVMIDVDLAGPSEFHSIAVTENDAWKEVEFDTSLARQMEEGITSLPKDDETQPLKKPSSPFSVARKPSVHLESSSKASSTDLKSVIKTRSIAVVVSASVSSVREAIDHIVKKCGGARRFKHFLKKSFSLYLRDTGGQVEFQEMVPLLISGPSIFFFVFRLDLDFKKKFRVEYRKSEGESLNSYTSSITTEEAFLQSLASVDSMDISDEVHGVDTHKPLVFIVGTHKDKLRSLAAEEIAELNEHLKSLIKAHHFEHLVQSADREKGYVMFTVDNTSENDVDFQLIRSKVNSLVRGRKEFTIEYPLRYLLFCLELQNMKATILTLDECKVIAAKFGIREDQLLHLLQFLHLRIGIIRYFDKAGVRHIVIKEPQVLFNAVTNLIVTTFSSEAITDEEASNFQNKGILTASVLDNISALCDISPEVFLELLVHLRIAAPFVTPGDQDKERNFFLPSVLNHVPESTGDLEEPATNILPLAVQFKCQHCPKGLFGVLVTHLLMCNDGATTTFTLMPDRIFKNQVSFIVCSHDSVYDQMALRTYTSHLEMKFFPGLSEDREVSITEVCSNVRQIVETAIHQSLRDLHYSERRAKPEMCFQCSDCNNFHAAKKCKIYCPVKNVTRCIPDEGKCWCYEGNGNGSKKTVTFLEVHQSRNQHGHAVCRNGNRNGRAHGDGVQRTEVEPQARDVNPYLKMLSTPQLYDLSGELGLNITELRRVSGQELPGELAERWLREDDAVYKTSGTPSWSSLIKALRSQVVGATGVADRIQQEKLT